MAMAIVGAVISGCGSGPNQVGSAAIIGPDAVSLTQVQSRIDAALSKTDVVAQLAVRGVGADDIARDVVTRAIMHDLLERTAATEGLTVTDAQIDQELTAVGGTDALLRSSLHDRDSLRQRVRDQLLAVELAKRYVDRLNVVVDIVAAPSRADAEAKARAIAAGGAAADAAFRTNAQRDLPFRAAADPEAASMALFGTPAGQIVVFQPAPSQSGWLVLKVVQRTIDAAATDPSAVSRIDETTLAKIGERLLQPLSQELGVRVNPRYGVWDPIQMRVVAAGHQAGSIITPAAG
ncbi:peptidyl-prolyl cis-trans isomerase [Pseudonocardia hispaniensis]|uniref:Peptidyl-prolyl cis-trans isomerase n=1 Tax=Pseudonocardia hispaniensis TaxID=904933 RepID=A0ABW1J061_9PSEU